MNINNTICYVKENMSTNISHTPLFAGIDKSRRDFQLCCDIRGMRLRIIYLRTLRLWWVKST